MFTWNIINLFVNQRDRVGRNLLKEDFFNSAYWFYIELRLIEKINREFNSLLNNKINEKIIMFSCS